MVIPRKRCLCPQLPQKPQMRLMIATRFSWRKFFIVVFRGFEERATGVVPGWFSLVTGGGRPGGLFHDHGSFTAIFAGNNP